MLRESGDVRNSAYPDAVKNIIKILNDMAKV